MSLAFERLKADAVPGELLGKDDPTMSYVRVQCADI